MSLLTVEDGTGVVGANALAAPSLVARYLRESGGVGIAATATLAGATVTATSLEATGLGDVVVAGRVLGVFADSSTAYVFVDAVDADVATLSWGDSLLSETSDVDLVLFDASTGWAGVREALEVSIIEATRYLAGFPWVGAPVAYAQALPWPRHGAYVGPGYPYGTTDELLSSSAVPEGVARAIAELALSHVVEGALVSTLSPGSALKRKKIGPIEKEWVHPLGSQAPRRFTRAMRHLVGLVGPVSATGGVVVPG